MSDMPEYNGIGDKTFLMIETDMGCFRQNIKLVFCSGIFFCTEEAI